VDAAAVTDRDDTTLGASADVAVGLHRQQQPIRTVTLDREDMHPRNVEQGIGALAPRVARDARTVIHVEVFNPSGSLVASDLEGLDTLIPAPPRRTWRATREQPAHA